MKEVDVVLEIKNKTNELSKLIAQRNNDLEISLFQTLESTLEMLHIFTPKIWNPKYDDDDDDDDEEEKDHIDFRLTTVVTASMLLSSIVRTLVTANNFEDDKKKSIIIHDVLVTADKFTNAIQRMKYLIKHDPLKANRYDFKLPVVTHLHQLVNSLLYIFSPVNNQYFSTMTPPTTPNSASFLEGIEDSLPRQQQNDMQQKDYVKNDSNNEKCTNVGSHLEICIHEYNTLLNTVSKRFMKSISSLKKANTNNNNNIPFLENHDRKHRPKIDEERPQSNVGFSLQETPKTTKNSIKGFFFTSHKRNEESLEKSNKTKQLKDVFDASSNNKNTENDVARSSVNTLVSPFKRNTIIRTTTATKTTTMNDDSSTYLSPPSPTISNFRLTPSDSGCFTSNIDSNTKNMNSHATSLTSIQKEFAEPVFIKQVPKSLKHNRSESDLKKSVIISSILKPWSVALSSSHQQQQPQLLSKDNNSSSGTNNWLKALRRYPSHYTLGKAFNSNDEILRQASQKGEGSILHMSENGKCVLIMELSNGRLQMISGTLERLFMKLADESAQDFDFVDTYIQSHLFFTTSVEFLENLMARFHLEALPGDYEYFRKWQRCIQVKVLNVISRWIKIQFQDFENNKILITRLEAFLNGDVNRAGFRIESDMIKVALDNQIKNIKTSRHVQITQALQSLVSFGSSTNTTVTTGSLRRRPSMTPSFLSFTSYTPPDSPTYLTTYNPSVPVATPPQLWCNIFLSIDTKEIARYLTLADFLILKCITVYDYLTVYLKKRMNKGDEGGDHTRTGDGYDYINMMTERANRLNKWVVYEVSLQKVQKYRRNTIRKMIEIAKLCLSWNNFHTSMVITMGLNQLPEAQDDTLESLLPSKDYQTFKQLLKYLDICNNMRYYRHAFKKTAKSPCVPFFPLILKDLTFLMDGNPTFLAQDRDLVNFTKFRSLTQMAHSVLNHTVENYYFAYELEYFPFFSPNTNTTFEKSAGPLDQVAEKIESRIRNCL